MIYIKTLSQVTLLKGIFSQPRNRHYDLIRLHNSRTG